MIVKFNVDGKNFSADLSQGVSIAIPLDFDGEQPSHFGAEVASRDPMKVGNFVGRTNQGGSCNVDWLRINPHCNGTHTETVGHIVNESVPVGGKVVGGFCFALLVTVEPELATQNSDETYCPPLAKNDSIVTRAILETASESLDLASADCLIVRTLPNFGSKLSAVYNERNVPAFFTAEAMQFIFDHRIKHLVVDLPSIDRMHDDGLLSNHHVFWNVPQGTREMTETTSTDRTITEMVYVHDRLSDGAYLLNLQIPAFCCDAAPSRPILFPVVTEDSDD